MIKVGTSRSGEEFSKAFVQTMHTRQIISFNWPNNLRMVTLTNDENIITNEQIEEKIQQFTKGTSEEDQRVM